MGNMTFDEWRIWRGDFFDMEHKNCIYVPEYHKYRDGWDHEHCAFCNRVFSETATEYAARHGYRTDTVHSKMDWICSGCFADMAEKFKLTLESRDYLYNCDQIPKTLKNEDQELNCELCSALIGLKRKGQNKYFVSIDCNGGEHIICEKCHDFMARGWHVESFEQFERDVMEYIAKETPEYEANIMAQYEKCRIIERKFTGHGFLSEFELADTSDPIGEEHVTQLGNLRVQIPGVEHVVGFVLNIEQGSIKSLEGFICGNENWPETITEYKVILL